MSISPGCFRWLFWLSVLISLVGMFILPLILIRLPPDYLSRQKTPDPTQQWFVRWMLLALRNGIALIFFIAGVIMLFTPGQGLLMLLAALWLASFPGKRSLEQKLAGLHRVARMINGIRARAGQPALELPHNQDRNPET